jgi:hypothetical protein
MRGGGWGSVGVEAGEQGVLMGRWGWGVVLGGNGGWGRGQVYGKRVGGQQGVGMG